MADVRTATEATSSPVARSGQLVVIAVLAIAFGLAVVGARTALWYDESNYLSLAGAIRQFGFPVWFWDPDHPALFLDSPPGLLYALSLLPDAILRDPAVVRTIYAAVGLLLPIGALLVYLRNDAERWLLLPIAIAVLCTTGFFYMELFQVRMDLPVAGLSFIGLALVASESRRIAAPELRRHWTVVLALFAVSAIALLTKYQAVCLSAAIGLWAVDELLHRRNPMAVLIAHGAGVILALAVIFGMARAFDGGGDQSLLANLQYNFGRILSSAGQGGPDFVRIGGLARATVALVAVPYALYLVARLASPAALKRDPLMRLSLYLSGVVLVFNLAMYRMPGAGGYYMIQAAPPLAYIVARSIVLLVRQPASVALATTGVVVVGALVTLPMGDQSPQRWNSGLPSLVQGIVEPDQSRIVADRLAGGLGPEQIVLLDSWRAQGRQLPYWLQRASRYGYLTQMAPVDAEALLRREGPGRVQFIVFSGSSAFATFRRPEWVETWHLIEANFEFLDQAGNPDWFVYRRKG